MHQQQQQLLQQQSQSPQPPQLIGSGTITVSSAAPNLADLFNNQELFAQIQQIDPTFAKFPDLADKSIEKEMRVMQQVMNEYFCDVSFLHANLCLFCVTYFVVLPNLICAFSVLRCFLVEVALQHLPFSLFSFYRAFFTSN